MARNLTMIATFVAAALFWQEVPLSRLFDAFQAMVTALAIFVAAVLVRLNRGMPTLEWKSADPERREILTSRILDVSKDYALILLINGVVLMWVIALIVVGKAQITSFWPEWVQKSSASLVGGGAALCISRVAYVVWRDIDIVALQKSLIDSSALREATQEQTKKSEDRIASIKSAGLRKIEVPAPRAWGE